MNIFRRSEPLRSDVQLTLTRKFHLLSSARNEIALKMAMPMFSVCVWLSLAFILYRVSGDASFYIYDWPADLGDVYPPAGAVLDKNSKYDHSFNLNNGAGEMLVPDVGLFQTWQFSLYKNVLTRLAVSKYRTRY